MTAGPAGRSITTSPGRFPARSGPSTSQRTGSSPTSSTATALSMVWRISSPGMPWRMAERRTSTTESYYETALGRRPKLVSDRWFCPTVSVCLPRSALNAATARRILIGVLAQDAGIFAVASELAPLHPRNDTFPGEVFLHLGADALDQCGASRADPVALEGIADRFLPERTFRGRDKRKLRFAVLAVAALHGGAEPDLLDEVVWWQTDDF